MTQIVPLGLLKAGERAEVVDVIGEEALIVRLAENGLRVGCRLEALSPGNPCLVRVGETRLSIRADGRVEILVSVMPTP